MENFKDPVVRSAIESLQKGDVNGWLENFCRYTELYDDGSKLDFLNFTSSVVGSEYFIRIDEVKNSGRDVYGHLHTKKWGDLNVCFKFHINEENKIYRLDVNQAASI